MTNKITLYRLKGEMPERKEVDTYVEFGCEKPHDEYAEEKGYNQALDDIVNKLEKVEIRQEDIANTLINILLTEIINKSIAGNFNRTRTIFVNELVVENLAQVILGLLKGERK